MLPSHYNRTHVLSYFKESGSFTEIYINPVLKQLVTTFLYGSNIEPSTEFLEQMAI